MTPDRLRALSTRLAAAGDHEAARAAEGLSLALAALAELRDDAKLPMATRRRAGRAWSLVCWGEPSPTEPKPHE